MCQYTSLFKKCLTLTMFASLSTYTVAGLVNSDKNSFSSAESVSFYLADMNSSNLAVKENSTLTIPVDISPQELMNYSVTSSNKVISVQLTAQQLVLNIGEVEADIAVELSLTNEQMPLDEGFEVTVNVINMPTLAISNYANLTVEQLLLSGRPLDFENYHGYYSNASWRFGLTKQSPLATLTKNAYTNRALNGNGYQVAGNGYYPNAGNNNQGLPTQAPLNESRNTSVNVANNTPVMPTGNSSNNVNSAPRFLPANYQIDHRLPTKAVPKLVRYDPGYQKALESAIEQSIAARQNSETTAGEQSDTDTETETGTGTGTGTGSESEQQQGFQQSEAQSPGAPQPALVQALADTPTIAPEQEANSLPALMENQQGLSQQPIVQVSEPKGLVLFLVALLALVVLPRRILQP